MYQHFLSLCLVSVILHSISSASLLRPRINGGQAVEVTRAPFMASLRELGHDQYKHLCGSVIISQKHVLTAAQCIHTNQASWFGITVGSNKKNDDKAEIHKIKRIVVHEDYDEFNAPFKHDIALIELENPLKLTDRVKFIPINTTFFEAQVDAETYGFGGAYDNNVILQQLKVQTMTNPECRSKVNKVPTVYDFGTLCAYSGDAKRRIGHGDAGGPLVHMNALIGIISWNPQVVGNVKPEGFTRISAYFEWIKKHAT